MSSIEAKYYSHLTEMNTISDYLISTIPKSYTMSKTSSKKVEIFLNITTTRVGSSLKHISPIYIELHNTVFNKLFKILSYAEDNQNNLDTNYTANLINLSESCIGVYEPIHEFVQNFIS